MRVSNFSPTSKFIPFTLRGPISSNWPRITGVVRELGVRVSRRVLLFDRVTGDLVEETMSNDAGIYSFTVGGPETAFFVVVLDDDVGTDFNALICDRVHANNDPLPTTTTTTTTTSTTTTTTTTTTSSTTTTTT